jgi:hypothetical protein
MFLPKALARPEIWCAIALLACFFLPWVSVSTILTATGAQIPEALKGIGQVVSAFGLTNNLRAASYLVYLVPVGAGLTILFTLSERPVGEIKIAAIAAITVPLALGLRVLVEFGFAGFDNVGTGGILTLLLSLVMFLCVFGVIRPNGENSQAGWTNATIATAVLASVLVLWFGLWPFVSRGASDGTTQSYYADQAAVGNESAQYDPRARLTDEQSVPDTQTQTQQDNTSQAIGVEGDSSILGTDQSVFDHPFCRNYVCEFLEKKKVPSGTEYSYGVTTYIDTIAISNLVVRKVGAGIASEVRFAFCCTARNEMPSAFLTDLVLAATGVAVEPGLFDTGGGLNSESCPTTARLIEGSGMTASCSIEVFSTGGMRYTLRLFSE